LNINLIALIVALKFLLIQIFVQNNVEINFILSKAQYLKKLNFALNVVIVF